MKRSFKYLILAIIIMAFALPASADKNVIKTWQIFNAETITAGATSTNVYPDGVVGFDMTSFKPDGYFALQITITGTGTGTFQAQMSNDGTNFAIPDGVDDIVAAMAAGTAIYQFSVPVGKYLRILCTEAGGLNSIVVTAYLTVQ